MAYLYINSPYSGDPVKIRQEDLGRAVRDGEGRVFYTLPRSDGNGYYGSITRIGGAKEEAQYMAMEAKLAQAQAVGAERSQRQIHDASGRARRSPLSRLAVLILLSLLVAAAVWLLTLSPWALWPIRPAATNTGQTAPLQMPTPTVPQPNLSIGQLHVSILITASTPWHLSDQGRHCA